MVFHKVVLQLRLAREVAFARSTLATCPNHVFPVLMKFVGGPLEDVLKSALPPTEIRSPERHQIDDYDRMSALKTWPAIRTGIRQSGLKPGRQ